MLKSSAVSDRNVWWIASAVVLVIGLLGLLDVPNLPYAGYSASRSATLTQVSPGSPAERAGLAVGDHLVEIGGVDAGDPFALFRQPRAKVGEARRVVLEREGQSAPLELDLTYSGLPASRKGQIIGFALVGLAFLVCGVGAYLTAGSAETRVLAFMGLAAMLGFAGPPYVAHATTRLALTLVPLAATLAIPALLVHFLLRSPTSRPVSRRVAVLLYGPVAALVAFSAVVLFAAPQLLSVASTIAPVVPLVQLAFAFGIVGRRYFKSGAAERTATGLNVLAAGLAVGLVPLLVAAFVPTLPGGRFYFLTLLLVPLALSRAALKTSPAFFSAAEPAASRKLAIDSDG